MATGTCVLFINKSAKSKSLSKSIGAERARIFSHVQRSPQGSLDGCKTPPEDFIKHDQPTIAVWQLATSRDVCAKKRKPRRKRQQQQDSPFGGASPDRTSPQSASSSDSSRSQSPVVALGVAEYDPFETTAVSITPYMKRLLQFYSSIMLDQVFVHTSLANVTRRRTLAYAAEDAVTLYAMLCIASAARYTYSNCEDDILSALSFKNYAIHHLMQELQKSTTTVWRISTVYAVALLLLVECLQCLQCDVDAVQAHTNGLLVLLTRVRESNAIPFPIMTTIVTCHYYCSAMLQTRPMIKPNTLITSLTPSPVTSIRSDAFALRSGKLCSRFFTNCNLRLLGTDLPRIILDQTRCLRFRVLWGHECSHPTTDDFEGSYQSQGPVDLALIDLPYKEGVSLTPIQEAVRLAFFSLTQAVIRIATPSSAFSRSMARQLCAAIDRCNLVQLWASKESSGMLLWIVFVALLLSREQQEWSSLITYLAMTAENLDLESQYQMREVFSGYVYSAKFCDETLDSAWRDIRLMSGANAIAI